MESCNKQRAVSRTNDHSLTGHERWPNSSRVAHRATKTATLTFLLFFSFHFFATRRFWSTICVLCVSVSISAVLEEAGEMMWQLLVLSFSSLSCSLACFRGEKVAA